MARLSVTCGVPVIPVGIVGTREIQPPGRMWMRPFRPVTVRFGEPLAATCGGRAARSPETVDPEELRELTDTLMAEIARLSGQEYVDEYARRSRSDERPAGPDVAPPANPEADPAPSPDTRPAVRPRGALRPAPRS